MTANRVSLPGLTRLPYRLAIGLILGTLLVSCTLTAGQSVPPDFQVSLERGPCFGTCPVYVLSVTADGGVIFNGMQFVVAEGERTASIPPDEVQAIHRSILDGGFFDLQDSYTVGATDLPSITTTVTMAGRTKSIYHYGIGCGSDPDSAPPALCAVESLLETIPIANGWVAGG